MKPLHPYYRTTPTQPLLAQTDPIADLFQILGEEFTRPEVLILSGMIALLALSSLWSGKRGKLTKAHWVGMSEKLKAVKDAQKQLNSQKINQTCLYCGSFPSWQMRGIIPYFITLLKGYPPTLLVPSANQSIEVSGRPNSGKTFSFINRALASAIEQGYPILLYDYKGGNSGEGGQIPFIATYAVRHGYKLRIFAPGRDYSCIINPLDFIRDPSDMTTAQALARTFHENLRSQQGKSDGFFGPAGQRLIYAVFQLAKSTPYPDLVMAFCLLQLPKLPKRLIHAAEHQLDSFPFWVRVGFTQLMQVAGAERTSGGIMAGAADLITEFMQRNLLPCYLGSSNTSLLLHEREILIFQSDILRQKVVNPLIASIINTLIDLNFSNQRKVPLVASFDELKTITISALPTWSNEHRSKGYVGIYGYQSIEQLEESYGKEGTSILRSALGTRVWFNPGNQNTAQVFSKYLGDTEMIVNTQAISRNFGSPGGQRTSSEQLFQIPLMRPEEFTAFRQGECVFINNAYQSSQRGDVPWHLRRIHIPKKDMKTEEECEQLWFKEVLPALRHREQQQRPSWDLEVEIQKRLELAEQLLPLPKEEAENTSSYDLIF